MKTIDISLIALDEKIRCKSSFALVASNIMPTHYFVKVQAGWSKQFAMFVFGDLARKSTYMHAYVQNQFFHQRRNLYQYKCMLKFQFCHNWRILRDVSKLN